MADSRYRKNVVVKSATSQRLQRAGRRATDAHNSTQKIAERVASELDELPTTGIPLLEVGDNDSLVNSIEKAIDTESEVNETVTVARTRSRDQAKTSNGGS